MKRLRSYLRRPGTVLHPWFPQEKGTYDQKTGSAWARWSVRSRA